MKFVIVSTVIAINFIFLLLIPVQLNCANSTVNIGPVISLEILNFIDVKVSPASTGIAVNVGTAGKVYIAVDSPPQIVAFDGKLSVTSILDQSENDLSTINDFSIANGFTLIITDYSSPILARTDNRLRWLTAFPLEEDGQIFQPASVTTSLDGQIYFANIADNEIWMVDRNGSIFRHSKIYGSIRLIGRKIEIMPKRNNLVILNKDELIFLNARGNIINGVSYNISMDNPSDIAVIDSEVWIGGDGIECYSLLLNKAVINLPEEKLIAMGINSISALAMDGDSILYILSDRGDKLIKAAIIRETSGE